MADAIDRNADTQNLYREVNERVTEVNRGFTSKAGTSGQVELIEIFCECGHQSPCDERVNVTSAAYERVRADPTLFLLLPGHGEVLVENVIERGSGYVIARNFGRAAVIARANDPRRTI